MTMMPQARFISIDGGNTRLKVTLFPEGFDPLEEKGEYPEVRCFSASDSDALMEWVEEICADGNPVDCAMAVVGHVDPRLTESLRKRLGDERFLLVTPSTRLPIGLRYATPHTLGLDRKAAACGAFALYGGGDMLMVIDAGSALTIDIVDEYGNFSGGNISPGLMMRFRALHEFTASLPMIETPERDFSRKGFDTRSAIIAGVEGGWVDEVAAMIRRGIAAGVKRVLLCGGDAGLLSELLERENLKVNIHHVPHLVALGLRVIYASDGM